MKYLKEKKVLLSVAVFMFLLGGVFLIFLMFQEKSKDKEKSIHQESNKTQKILDQELTIETTIPQTGNRICFSSTCFEIEIADTDQERSYGLMFRKFLPQKSGMLFIFDTPRKYGFWMKNTLIPLDMLWLDMSGTIVSVAHQAQPCGEENSKIEACPNYSPTEKASYVLEINAGLANTFSLKPGIIGKIQILE